MKHKTSFKFATKVIDNHEVHFWYYFTHLTNECEQLKHKMVVEH